eukprot:TRINITY_DN7239_c0_g1_i1.p1 TRINITY_DN7239_c0_g1~~TRINITY_DN7239_c0_g1_i1.p1  ORF type:complete len:104 (-),score=12.70 TRINITY_DN7239_c0_g1_i1:73-384(-)
MKTKSSTSNITSSPLFQFLNSTPTLYHPLSLKFKRSSEIVRDYETEYKKLTTNTSVRHLVTSCLLLVAFPFTVFFQTRHLSAFFLTLLIVLPIFGLLVIVLFG